MPLTLYYMSGSPPARAALLAIRNLGLDAEIKNVDLLGGETRTEAYMKMNPQHTVPTLDDDGFYLWESRAIITYLAASKAPGSTLYPADPKEQAVVNQRLYFDIGTLGSKFGLIVGPVMRANATTISEEAIQGLHTALAVLEGYLEKSDYIAGKNLTLADLSILATIASLVHIGLQLSKYKGISAWYDRLKTIPGYAENEEGSALLGAYFKSKLGKEISF